MAGEIGLGFNRPTKLKLFGTWTGIQNALDEYGESLSGPQLEKIAVLCRSCGGCNFLVESGGKLRTKFPEQRTDYEDSTT